jgi:hypothetical protein
MPHWTRALGAWAACGMERCISARCVHGYARVKVELGGGLNSTLLATAAGPAGHAMQGKIITERLALASQWHNGGNMTIWREGTSRPKMACT